eukprot:6188674-Pleurochrysis_carterae.AAC.1
MYKRIQSATLSIYMGITSAEESLLANLLGGLVYPHTYILPSHACPHLGVADSPYPDPKSIPP